MTGPPHLPFRPASQAALDVARRLFSPANATATDDATLIASAERIAGSVPDGLARWFGPYGSLALMTRALATAEASNPALASVRVSGAPSPRLMGIADSAQTNGAIATAEAVIALLATLHELLSRLIGEDMALVLLRQCVMPPVANGVVNSAGSAHSPDEKLSQTMDEQ